MSFICRKEVVCFVNKINEQLQSTENIIKLSFIIMWGLIFFSVIKALGGVFSAVIVAKYDNHLSIDYIGSVDTILVAVVSLFNLPWLLICLIFIAIYSNWLYRAYSNLHDVHIQGLTSTPAWAVGWNFIPLLHLIKPYSIMKEIWQATFYAEDETDDWKKEEVSGKVRLWWLFFIIGLVTWPDWFQFGQTFLSFKVDIWLTIVSGISFVVSGLMIQKIMKQITAEQLVRFKQEER